MYFGSIVPVLVHFSHFSALGGSFGSGTGGDYG